MELRTFEVMRTANHWLRV